MTIEGMIYMVTIGLVIVIMAWTVNSVKKIDSEEKERILRNELDEEKRKRIQAEAQLQKMQIQINKMHLENGSRKKQKEEPKKKREKRGLESSKQRLIDNGVSEDETLALFDTSIDVLDLPARTYNCLTQGDVRTVGAVLEKTPEELMRLRNFGKGCLDELRQKLAAIYLTLDEDEENMAACIEQMPSREDELRLNVKRCLLLNEQLSTKTPGVGMSFDDFKLLYKKDLTDDERASLLSSDIDTLDLSVRATNCLRKANINTIGALIDTSREELLLKRNLGKKRLEEIEKKLAMLGEGLSTRDWEEKTETRTLDEDYQSWVEMQGRPQESEIWVEITDADIALVEGQKHRGDVKDSDILKLDYPKNLLYAAKTKTVFGKEFASRFERAVFDYAMMDLNDEKEKYVIMQRYQERKTYRDIAEDLGISVEAVRQRKHKAVIKIARRLAMLSRRSK